MRRLVALALIIIALLPFHFRSASAAVNGYVTGKVSSNGKPVAGAVITTNLGSSRSNSAGSFSMRPVGVLGNYRMLDVTVRANGYGVWTLRDARVMPNDTLQLTVQLKRSSVTLAQTSPLSASGQAGGIQRAGRYTVPRLSPTSDTSLIVPSTIRVYVTSSNVCDPEAPGTTETIPFKEYVKHVLPNEWFASWEQPSLDSGAVAVKNYAWYWIAHGGKWPRLGADVMDSQCDQVYNPAVSYASTDQAVEETWNWAVVKKDIVWMAQYWAGTKGDGNRPAADSKYAGRLSQWGSEYWAEQDQTWQWILHYYYDDPDYPASIVHTGDTVSPVASISEPRFTRSTDSFPVNWSATDDYSGVAQYQVQWYNGKWYANWITSATRTEADFGVAGSPVALQPNRTYYLRMRATDKAGNSSPWQYAKTTLEYTPPTAWVWAPSVSTSSSSSPRFTASWGGTDKGSGVDHYQVQYYNGSQYANWLSNTTNRSATFGASGQPIKLQPARTYHLRVRSFDKLGNASSWRYAITSVPADDVALSNSGGWRYTSGAVSHYLGTLHYTGTDGAVSRYKFWGKKVYWVGDRGTDKGKAQVRIDGQLVATVDTYSASYQDRVVVFQMSLGNTNAGHTIEIRVLGQHNSSSTGTRVDVDGIGFVR